MMRIKINDTVLVLSGKDKGKKGTVIDVQVDKNRVKVKDIALVTKHIKSRKQGQPSEIKQLESYINISNVMLINPSDSKPTRVNFKVMQDGKKVRVCNRTEEII